MYRYTRYMHTQYIGTCGIIYPLVKVLLYVTCLNIYVYLLTFHDGGIISSL
jgi:hypothetical protein